jgi:aspartate kinase
VCARARDTSQAVAAIPQGTVAVITGFIGKDVTGRVTTLGRGGSDLTASLIGAAAGCDEVQVRAAFGGSRLV